MPIIDHQPRLVLDARCDIGENPLWHDETATLVFIDITAGRIHRYHPASGRATCFDVGFVVGGMTIQVDGALGLFGEGTVTIAHADGKLEQIHRGLLRDGERFNDVIADPRGRVFAGTVRDHGRVPGGGRLLRLDPDGSVHVLLSDLDIPNGLGFSLDHALLYLTDSRRRTIRAYRYDADTGTLGDSHAFVTLPMTSGCPDGMTVDAFGHVWTAVWHGACLRRYAPDGSLERDIMVPIRQPSALTFGGDGLQDIFLTSAASTVGDALAPVGIDRSRPAGGGLYVLQLPGIVGQPALRSRLTRRRAS